VIAIDTSAIAAIAFDEAERGAFVDIVKRADRVLVSAPTVLEARMVVFGRRGPRALVLLDDLVRLPSFEIVPLGEVELSVAWAAFVAYGKGSGHPAGLNYGDVFSYAVAKARGVPLLFKGEDFVHTDIEAAWRPDPA
jgi:ribonuclease VapC